MPAVALRDVIDTQGTEAALVLLLMIVQQLKVTINAADLVFALENDGAARVCKESIDECGGILLTTHSLVEVRGPGCFWHSPPASCALSPAPAPARSPRTCRRARRFRGTPWYRVRGVPCCRAVGRRACLHVRSPARAQA